MNLQNHVTVLSPHLDDAALGCADHILSWLGAGYKISVLTIFGDCASGLLSDYMHTYMQKARITSLEDLESMRKREDALAMQRLGVSWKVLDYVDAGFRSQYGHNTYPDYKTLCARTHGITETALLDNLVKEIKAFSKSQIFLIPFAVGHHIDHRLVRAATEQAVPPTQIAYYLDMPYALNPRKWSIRQMGEVVSLICKRHWSYKWITPDKRLVLSAYQSQMPYLFRIKPCFPEFVIYPKDCNLVG